MTTPVTHWSVADGGADIAIGGGGGWYFYYSGLGPGD